MQLYNNSAALHDDLNSSWESNNAPLRSRNDKRTADNIVSRIAQNGAGKHPLFAIKIALYQTSTSGIFLVHTISCKPLISPPIGKITLNPDEMSVYCGVKKYIGKWS